jgi:hypothetical protein
MTHGQLKFDKFLTFGHFVAFLPAISGSLKVHAMQHMPVSEMKV